MMEHNFKVYFNIQVSLLIPLSVFDFRHKLADKMIRKTMERGDFRLLHYAGEVTYCVVGK